MQLGALAIFSLPKKVLYDVTDAFPLRRSKRKENSASFAEVVSAVTACFDVSRITRFIKEP